MRKLCSGSSASARARLLQRVEDLVVLGEEALEQLPGEVVLVLEMVEEAALGDPRRLDQLVDRGRGEALVDDRIIGDVEDPARVRSPLVGAAAPGNCTAGAVFSISFSTIAHASPDPARPSYQNAALFSTAVKSDRKAARAGAARTASSRPCSIASSGNVMLGLYHYIALGLFAAFAAIDLVARAPPSPRSATGG